MNRLAHLIVLACLLANLAAQAGCTNLGATDSGERWDTEKHLKERDAGANGKW